MKITHDAVLIFRDARGELTTHIKCGMSLNHLIEELIAFRQELMINETLNDVTALMTGDDDAENK